MPEVRDYASGNILALINRGFALFKYAQTPLLGPMVRGYGLKILNKCAPQKISESSAVSLIEKSDRCAVGQRVCNALHDGADHGESVFLDELAVALAEAGKAVFASKQQAINTLTDGRKGPIMITRVSGKYMEICRSIPKNCIYWNSEKHGLKCIGRNTV